MKDYKLSLPLQVRSCRGLLHTISPDRVFGMWKAGVPIDQVGAMIVVDVYGVKQPARVFEAATSIYDSALVELFRGRQN